MRVIVTEQGGNIITILEEKKKVERGSSTHFKNKSHHTTKSFGGALEAHSTSLDHFGSQIKNDKLRKAKPILINQNKIAMPKIMSEKYQLNSNETSILPTLPERVTRRFENSNMQTEVSTDYQRTEEGLRFKEILNDKAISNLKKTIIWEKRMKDKLATITEKNFRSVYNPRTELQEMEEKLENSLIGSDKISIIRYVYEKPKVSKHLITKLATIGEQQQNKLNKICHVYFKEREREELRNTIVKEKMSLKSKKLKFDIEETLGNAYEDLNKFTGLTQNYKPVSHSLKRKEIFNKYHNDFKDRYWNRYNSNHLQRRTNIEKSNPNDSFLK